MYIHTRACTHTHTHTHPHTHPHTHTLSLHLSISLSPSLSLMFQKNNINFVVSICVFSFSKYSSWECPIGQYRESCSSGHDSYCRPCTNKPDARYAYVSPGNTNDCLTAVCGTSGAAVKVRHARTCSHLHTHTHAHAHAWCVSMYITCAQMHTNTCTHAHTRARTHTHTHTHIHTHSACVCRSNVCKHT